MPADAGAEILNALRRSEERYARALEASGDGYTDWIVATDEFYASPPLLEMCGLPPDTKFGGRADFVARFPVHPEDRDRIANAVNAHYAGTAARFELDMRVLRRGEMRWMHAVFLCSRDTSGALARVSTAVTDVTDRKLAEDELRLRKEELQRLMESVSDYLWSAEVGVDGSYTYRYYSPVVERITGCPPGKLLESRECWVQLLHPLDRQRVDEAFRQLMSGAAEQVEVEYRIVRPDGTLRWVRDSAHGTRVEDGRILLYGVVSDITERKLGAEALRASEARFRALTELSSDWYWEQDENLRFTYLSSQVNELTGHASESSLGQTRWELSGMAPISSSWEEHRAVLAAHQSFRDFEFSRAAPDGTIKFLSVSGAPVFDEQGRFKGYQGVGRNITERRRIDEELRESEQKYRTLFDSIDEGFCTIEVLFDGNAKPVDYRFLQVNPSFERQTGIKTAVGRRMREIAPQHEEHWFEIYGRIALTGEPMRFENEARQLGRWYDVYAFRLEDPKPQRVGILFNDITGRKRLERQLRMAQRLEAM